MVPGGWACEGDLGLGYPCRFLGFFIFLTDQATAVSVTAFSVGTDAFSNPAVFRKKRFNLPVG